MYVHNVLLIILNPPHNDRVHACQRGYLMWSNIGMYGNTKKAPKSWMSESGHKHAM